MRNTLDWEPITHMWFVKATLSIYTSATTDLGEFLCAHCSFRNLGIVQGYLRKVHPEPLELEDSIPTRDNGGSISFHRLPYFQTAIAGMKVVHQDPIDPDQLVLTPKPIRLR